MAFKELIIEPNINYSDIQNESISFISEKINKINVFFEKIVELENLFLMNLRKEYVDLVKIREKRKEIEEAGGPENYINNYFLKNVESISEKISLTKNEWDSIEKDYKIHKIKEKIEVLKKIHSRLCCEESEDFKSLCDIINYFGKFQIYKVLVSDSKLEQVETLVKQKDLIMNTLKKEKTSTKKSASIDDL